MINRKWKVTLGILLLTVLFAAGYFALAAEYGSQEDPLVTLSYITDVVSPGTLKKVDEEITAKMESFQKSLEDKMTQFSSEMDNKIASGAVSDTPDPALVDAVADQVLKKLQESGSSSQAADWQLIDFAKDKTITMSIGTEVLLRIGSANVVSSGTPGLINLTSATEANNGAALEKNSLYIVTIEGRGIKATANCKILIRGTYTMN